MKQIAATALALSLLTTPTLAEDKVEDGLGKLSEGSRLLFEGLMGELEPMMEDLSAELLPFMETLRTELGEAFEGLNAYHPPEVLENGDILLRRKAPGDAPKVDENEDGTIDL